MTGLDKGYNPQVLFWIAEYKDGQALPQYNPDTGEECLFKSVDQNRLVTFGWYPFSPQMAIVLQKKGIEVRPVRLPSYVLRLSSDMRLIALRRQYVRKYTFHLCGKCGVKWEARPGGPTELIEIAIQNLKEVPYKSYACPNCGNYNRYVCPDCRNAISKNDEDQFYCKQCSEAKGIFIEYPKTTVRIPAGQRETVYMLGWQRTFRGRNIKSILYIYEDGVVRVDEEPDKGLARRRAL